MQQILMKSPTPRCGRLSNVSVPIVISLLCVGSTLPAADRPNVLWIIADDLSLELSCYGYKGVHTPHVDRLAEQGGRYTQAFATSPVCSSSRSALITGVYQTSTGTHQHRTTHKQPLPAPVEPVSELMRRAGYFVCNSDSSMMRPGKQDYNFDSERNLFDSPDWSGRKQGQPFFAQVQIHEPHRNFAKAEPARREVAVEIPSYYPEHPVIRADWANYLATIEVLDRNVGEVLARLGREGLADDTVVFFFGDHGRPHYRDKQWLYDGGLGVPLIIRWPRHVEAGSIHDELVSLIDVSATTLAVAGLDIPDWMQGTNMLAEGFHGRDMIFAARDRCGSTIDRIRCLRTKRFKYIRNFYPERPYSQHSGYKVLQYPGITVARVLHQRGELNGPPALFWMNQRPVEELYDLDADPEEVNNLAADRAYAQPLAELRARLDHWMQHTNDQGGVPEVDLQATIESSEDWYRSAMQKRGLPAYPDPERYLTWWQKELGIE
jgi:uncharacterized sulfatase